MTEIKLLWGSQPGTPDGDRFDVIATLVDAYEKQRWPAPALDPVDTIKAHMELNGLTQGDLAEVLGSQARASEVLARKRGLTLDHIRKLEAAWRLSPERLVARYDLKVASIPSESGRRKDRAAAQKAAAA